MADAPSIYVALAKVMGDVRAVAKGDRNNAQNFSFRGIDAVLNAVGPALRTHGVIVVPFVQTHETEIVETGKNRTPMKAVTLTVQYTFYGPAGDSIISVVPGEAFDSGDKAFSKAMSVALRTALIQTLALPTDEKDPDHEVYERAPAERPTRAPQQQGNGNGQAKPPDPRALAWQRAWAAAKAISMTRQEFADDFAKEAGVAEKDGTAEQFTTYAQMLEAAQSAPAAS